MKNIVLSGQLEIQLLLFLWKWKVSTSSALIHAFYENRPNRMAYERLRKLEGAALGATKNKDRITNRKIKKLTNDNLHSPFCEHSITPSLQEVPNERQCRRIYSSSIYGTGTCTIYSARSQIAHFWQCLLKRNEEDEKNARKRPSRPSSTFFESDEVEAQKVRQKAQFVTALSIP